MVAIQNPCIFELLLFEIESRFSGFPGISKSGCDILSTYQKIYSSALLQYCLVTYQKAGPTRFTDLLAVFQVIIKMRQDLSYLSTFLSICGFAVTKKKLYNCWLSFFTFSEIIWLKIFSYIFMQFFNVEIY